MKLKCLYKNANLIDIFKALSFVLILIAVTLFLISCAEKQKPEEKESGFIEISGEQFLGEGMELGEIQLRVFEKLIKANGTIVPQSEGVARVSPPVSGLIKKINCHTGQFINKGQILFELSGNEVIDIQRDFAESSANFSRIKSEYERVKSLFAEKVISEKDFILTESEYKASLAKYNGLKLKIATLGFSASGIEKGEFNASYTISSPIRGVISNINASIGSYVEQQTALIEITDPTMFQVQLSVFANDIENVKTGQIVRFKPVNSDVNHFAVVSSVGVNQDIDSKSIKCYCSITDKKEFNSIANVFVESEIITGTDSVYSLPESAILKTETGNSILILEKKEGETYFFKESNVNTGRRKDGYIEILDGEIDGKIIVKGTYNITL